MKIYHPFYTSLETSVALRNAGAPQGDYTRAELYYCGGCGRAYPATPENHWRRCDDISEWFTCGVYRTHVVAFRADEIWAEFSKKGAYLCAYELKDRWAVGDFFDNEMGAAGDFFDNEMGSGPSLVEALAAAWLAMLANEKRAETQAIGLDAARAGFVADVVDRATTEGRLQYAVIPLVHCKLCGRRAECVPFKSGRSKGKPNIHRPITFPGVELSHSFVTIRHHATLGCCLECWQSVKPTVAAALSAVRAFLPEAIMGIPPKYSRHTLRRCTACGWEGHEGQMRRLPTLVRDGTYPGGCPACKANNEPLGQIIVELRPGFVVVEKE